jgi:hypothetical protein
VHAEDLLKRVHAAVGYLTLFFLNFLRGMSQ